MKGCAATAEPARLWDIGYPLNEGCAYNLLAEQLGKGGGGTEQQAVNDFW